MPVMAESARLDSIEIKLAHLERSLQELGETVMHHRREIEVLQARNQALQNQLEVLEGQGDSATQFERPPHY
jgi:uncharacterized coiled-coil protein SlyX